MARTNHVKHARKEQGLCMVCRDESRPLNIGSPYKWVKPRYGRRVVAHPDCAIPMSMVSSSKMAGIYDDVSALNRDGAESVVEGLRGLANTVREVGEEYQEGADNQREYFPDSETADESEEKAQELDSWADELESAADEAESEIDELDKLQEELDDPDTADERKEELDSEIENKQDEILAHLDVADECPV